ncbi:ATP synthase F1, gamma subunit [Chthoniobacter flavus Ellin428]|uniref:ATP synthase gamma chain n=1 Tax=Chthoniobacter flavus Ellin428 TaxID=497964 RepID=B4D6F0_9BACT|nr:ATP synthase F1 subunit gamma [Chthoniobacter flavus]EDY18059.1 ATP synthase F1, gamma subunit [Chthoniobacter flavus Ellin428]TCO88300.1 F-type H+-transporting ATPase subunit gamma [Chthoniobacter flavus]
MAANTRDIRRRIKSVKNTAQITKAMQMVAASKMRKAQQLAIDGRPYAQLLNKISAAVNEVHGDEKHPLLQQREVKKELVIIISTDKGLCGALNTNLLREAAKFDPEKTLFITGGRKAAQWAARSRRNLIAEFQLKDTPSFVETKVISKMAIEQFLDGSVDKVSVLVTRFVNTLTQEPVVFQLLPVSASPSNTKDMEAAREAGGLDVEFEPNSLAVLDALLPYYAHFAIYRAVVEARAAEHSARMVAMKSATDNAKSLIKDLTLEYNKIRQASITTELLEITTAQMALG